jgi:single-stranded-DNA-specific exonuclease
LTVDIETSFGPIDYRVAEELASLSPFGIGNPSPLVITKNVVVENASLIGESHVRLRLSDGRHSQNAVAWNQQGNPLLRKGELITVVYSPELNTYQGITSVQLNIREIWQEAPEIGARVCG